MRRKVDIKHSNVTAITYAELLTSRTGLSTAKLVQTYEKKTF